MFQLEEKLLQRIIIGISSVDLIVGTTLFIVSVYYLINDMKHQGEWLLVCVFGFSSIAGGIEGIVAMTCENTKTPIIMYIFNLCLSITFDVVVMGFAVVPKNLQMWICDIGEEDCDSTPIFANPAFPIYLVLEILLQIVALAMTSCYYPYRKNIKDDNGGQMMF